MLNIKDIEKRLKENPEPDEVKEIRENITNTFSNLEFIEDGHKYYLHKPDGNKKEMTSVTTICHKKFEPYVDWDVILERKALNLGIAPEDLKREWKEKNITSTSNGTLTHLFAEGYMHFFMGNVDLIPEPIKKMQYEDGFLIPYGNKQKAVAKYYEDMFRTNGLYPVMPEAQIYIDAENNPYGIKYDISGTFDALFAFKDNNGKWKLSVRDWKGLPLDTPIPTVNGWKTMGEMQIGDTIFDKNGKPTKVLHVSSIHHNPCYKITFDNNDEIIADCDHRWEISFWEQKKDENGKHLFSQKVMTTKEISDYMFTIRNKKQKKYPKILVSKPLDCEKKILPIDPYVFGCWLGDGNSADGKITNMYKELWHEIERRGYTIGNDVSQGGAGKAQTRNVYGLTHELRLLGCLHNKHIPDIFMFSSFEQRLDLLRGFMDTDGYYNKTRKRFVMATTKKWQADALYTLLSSLGVKASIIKTKGRCNNCKKYKNGMFDKYDVSFTSDFNPFLIRNISFEKPLMDKRSFRNIIKVERVKTIETKCLEVDSDTHTFCCGHNMLVTHNTNHSLENDFNRNKCNTLLAPFNTYEFIDEPKSMYVLQLSLYQLGLEQLGYKVVDRKLLWLTEDCEYHKIDVRDVTKELIQGFSI